MTTISIRTLNIVDNDHAKRLFHELIIKANAEEIVSIDKETFQKMKFHSLNVLLKDLTKRGQYIDPNGKLREYIMEMIKIAKNEDTNAKSN